MKIAQVTKYFYPHNGEIETQVIGISNGFAERGHRVLIFTSNKPWTRRQERLRGLRIFRSSVFFTLFNGPFAPGVFIDLMKRDYDLIHLHLPDPFNSIFALIASKVRKKPLFVTYHTDVIKDRWYHKPFKFLHNFFLGGILRNAKKIIATSPNYVECSNVLKEFRGKIETVPNFVYIGRFNSRLRGAGVISLYGLERKRIILFLGRLVPYKGVDYLVRAFKDVGDEIKDVVLIIAGDGPLKNELKQLVGDLGLNGVLFVSVAEEDLPHYYAACDVFALPSVTRQEAFGVVLLEAMACGKPVIATNVGGVPYVVGESGIIVEPRNTEALSSAISKILSDNEFAKKLGGKARARVEDEFNLDLVTEKILKIYRS
ncbi:MAG: glycosyltransferase [Candidatus Altiarchaeota archaeon]|nr:glycosyltransferase [Candidatus Altiarchaeota archaeon]